MKATLDAIAKCLYGPPYDRLDKHRKDIVRYVLDAVLKTGELRLPE